MAVDINQITAWLTTADTLFQTPIVRQVVLPLVKSLLPPLGVTPEQMAQLDAHHAELERREADARARASRL